MVLLPLPPEGHESWCVPCAQLLPLLSIYGPHLDFSTIIVMGHVVTHWKIMPSFRPPWLGNMALLGNGGLCSCN